MEWCAGWALAKADDIGAACVSKHVVYLGCRICEQLCSKGLLTLQTRVLFIQLFRGDSTTSGTCVARYVRGCRQDEHFIASSRGREEGKLQAINTLLLLGKIHGGETCLFLLLVCKHEGDKRHCWRNNAARPMHCARTDPSCMEDCPVGPRQIVIKYCFAFAVYLFTDQSSVSDKGH